MKTALIIPARYASTRFPGKPLAMIAGQTMLQRVVRLAQKVAAQDPKILVAVATDDDRIAQHAASLGVACVISQQDCATGTDRVQGAAAQLADPSKWDFAADFVINLQGDAPLTPPDFIRAMIEAYRTSPCDVMTPVTQLTWEQLDLLWAHKVQTPFSGTTAVFNPKTGLAHWFSKNIIPAVRKEKDLRASGEVLSPVWRHIGLYGYRRTFLDRFVSLPEGVFEQLEGLEQLRILEHGYKIRCVPVSYQGRPAMTGIDSPEDIIRAEELLKQYGELI